jgi:hypothetical protein
MRRFSLLVIAFCLCFPFSGYAQSGCSQIRGLGQLRLFDFDYLTRAEDDWGGPVQILVGNTDLLLGNVSCNDGEVWGPPRSWVAHGRGGSCVYDFGNADTFITRTPEATWNLAPKSVGVAFIGYFRGTGYVESGTGRFLNTTGTVQVEGPFDAWNLDANPPETWPAGRYNSTYSGFLCNVGPPSTN